MEMARGGWYGPLIELSSAAEHLGHFVQLIVLVLQRRPSEDVSTTKGPSTKAVMFVGDRSRLYFKVTLWQSLASCEVSAGDVVFLKNLKIREFHGQLEATSLQYSCLAVLINRFNLLSCAGDLQDLQFSSAIKDKLKLVVQWARETQSTFLTFLSGISRNNKLMMRESMHMESGASKEAIQMQHVINLACINAPCEVIFSARISEILLVPPSSNCDSHPDIVSISKLPFVKESFDVMGRMVCIGCTNCGGPLELDQNRVFERCRCLTKKAESSSSGYIYCPFLVHVWDESAQLALKVTNSAAEQMFAGLSAENIWKEIQNQETGMKGAFNKLLDNDGKFSDVETCVPDSLFGNTSGSNQDELNMSSMFKWRMILFTLLKALTSKRRNSPFQFRAVCQVEDSGNFKEQYFELVSFSL